MRLYVQVDDQPRTIRFLRNSVYNETANGSPLSKRRTVFIWMSQSYGNKVGNDAAKGYDALKAMLSGAKPVSIAECKAFCSETTFFRGGGTFGALPQAPLRGLSPQTPFSASRRFEERLEESGDASLPDSCFFKSLRDFGVTGLPWAAAQTRLRGLSPQTPIFASRRFQERGGISPGR